MLPQHLRMVPLLLLFRQWWVYPWVPLSWGLKAYGLMRKMAPLLLGTWKRVKRSLKAFLMKSSARVGARLSSSWLNLR